MPPVILVFTVTGSALFVISCFFLGWGAKADDSGSNPLKTVGWIGMVAGIVDLLSALYIVTRSGLPAAAGTSAADAAKKERSAQVVSLEKQLSDHLSSKVRIKARPGANKGRIEIEFYDLDHFDSLMDKLGFSAQ